MTQQRRHRLQRLLRLHEDELNRRRAQFAEALADEQQAEQQYHDAVARYQHACHASLTQWSQGARSADLAHDAAWRSRLWQETTQARTAHQRCAMLTSRARTSVQDAHVAVEKMKALIQRLDAEAALARRRKQRRDEDAFALLCRAREAAV